MSVTLITNRSFLLSEKYLFLLRKCCLVEEKIRDA